MNKCTYFKESAIERKYCAVMKAQGWVSMKCVVTGFPDRVFFKGDEYKFVEFKAHNGRLSKVQILRFNELKRLGIKVFIFQNDKEILWI